MSARCIVQPTALLCATLVGLAAGPAVWYLVMLGELNAPFLGSAVHVLAGAGALVGLLAPLGVPGGVMSCLLVYFLFSNYEPEPFPWLSVAGPFLAGALTGVLLRLALVRLVRRRRASGADNDWSGVA